MTIRADMISPIFWTLPLVLGLFGLLSGCTDSYELTLRVDTNTVVAGETITYSIEQADDGQTVDAEAIVVLSDIEPDIDTDGSALTPTVAGRHTVTAVVAYQDSVHTVQESFTATPGPPGTVDLFLEQDTMVAGQETRFAIQMRDRYGNEVEDGYEPQLSIDRNGLVVEDDFLRSSEARDYVITLTVGSLTDEETLTVVPDRAVSIELHLVNPDVEVGDIALTWVDVRDAFGNRAEDPWTLSAEGTGSFAIAGPEIRFHEDGVYTLTATVDGTQLDHTIAPLVIDSTGPDIDIVAPERASWATSYQNSIVGSIDDAWSGLDAVTVQGEAVTLQPDGTLDAPLICTFGTNLLVTSARDSDGNRSTDTRAMLVGDFGAYGSSDSGGDAVTRGIDIRLYEGTGGLAALEHIAATHIDASVLDDEIPDPAVALAMQDCGGGLCLTHQVQLTASNPQMLAAQVWLDPRADGTIDARWRAHDPSLMWHGNAQIASVAYSGTGDIHADYLDVHATLTPQLATGQIAVSVSDVNAVTHGFVFDMEPWLASVLDLFGVRAAVEVTVREAMELAAINAVQERLPLALTDVLNQLAAGQTLTAHASSSILELFPSHLSVDEDGITLGLATYMHAEHWALSADYPYLGSLRADYTPPLWGAGTGIEMAFSGDFLNQMLLSSWGAGWFSLQLTDRDLDIRPEQISTIFPGVSELIVVLEPLLPPVVVPGTGEEILSLQIGDHRLIFYSDRVSPETLLIKGYVTAFAATSMDSSGMQLTPMLQDFTPYFDVVQPASGWENLETNFDLFFAPLENVIQERLGAIPLPGIDGVTLNVAQIYRTGSDGGYVAVAGSLAN